jgi:hypothetical protein
LTVPFPQRQQFFYGGNRASNNSFPARLKIPNDLFLPFGALDKLQGISWNRLRKRKSVRITKDLSEKSTGVHASTLAAVGASDSCRGFVLK